MPLAELGGVKTNWATRPGPGPTMVFCHCSLASHRAWAGVVAALGPEPDCVLMDLPGHGGSGHDPARDILDQAVSALTALIDRLDRPVHVVGHSFGAVTALKAAMIQPVAALTLYEPVIFGVLADAGHPRWKTELAAHERFKAALATGAEPGLRWFLDRFGEPGGFDRLPPSGQAYALGRIRLIPLADAALFGPVGGVRPSLADIAATDLAPHLICGDDSPEVLTAIIEVLATALPKARVSRLPGAGHMGPLTHPAELAALVHPP